MISPIPALSFKSGNSVSQDPLSRPGAYSNPVNVVPEAKSKKESKKWLTALGIVGVAAAAVAAVTVGYNKGLLKVLDAVELKNAKILDKAKHYLGKAGEFMDEKVFQKLKSFLPKAK